MAIKIGTSTAKEVYVGTSRAKHVYLDKNLVFSRPVKVTFTLDVGIANLSVKTTTKDNKVSTVSYYSTVTAEIPYESYINITATAKTGYTLNNYTSGTTITADRTISYTTTVNKFWTDVNLNYNGTQYGGSYGDRFGTFQYSRNGSTWYGPYSNEPWDTSTLFEYDSYLYLRSITAAPGFYLSNVRYNGVTQYSSGGIYSIRIGNGSYNVEINYAATTNSSSTSFYYASSITTNTLSRNAFNVSFSLNIDVAACSAGAVIGNIPYQYRPSSARTYTTNWEVRKDTGDVITTATITIHANGNITSNKLSQGEFVVGGGGKWGSGYITYITKIAISGSYSII